MMIKLSFKLFHKYFFEKTATNKWLLELMFIFTFFSSGRGVFTREYIEPKSFVVEYRGVVSQSEGADDKNNKYVFDFMWNGKRYW